TIKSNIYVRTEQSGLDLNVRWAHIIDTVQVGRFLQGGEILLTSGELWPNNIEEEIEFLNSIGNKASGIIFATGHYIYECPQSAVQFGKENDIAIMEMSFNTPFVHITLAINKYILNQQNLRTSLLESIPLNIAGKLIKAETLNEVCNNLAFYLNSSVILTNPQFEVITSVCKKNILSIEYTKKIIKSLSKEIDFRNNRETSKVLNLTYGSTTISIICLERESKYWGILWVLTPTKRANENIIKYASIMLTDIYMQQKELKRQQNKLQKELLDSLLQKESFSLNIVRKKASSLNMLSKTHNKYFVGVISSTSKVIEDLNILLEEYNNLVEETKNIDGFCQFFESQLVILIRSKMDEKNIVEKINSINNKVISKVEKNYLFIFGRSTDDIQHINKKFQEARLLETIIKKVYNISVNSEQQTYFSQNFLNEVLLYKKFNYNEAKIIKNHVLPSALFIKRNNIYYETLLCLVQNNFNRKKCFSSLKIHPNTLQYRIEKIEYFINDSLSSPKCQFWVSLAINLQLIFLQDNNKELKSLK